MTSALEPSRAPTCFGLADFRSKANLTDITDPLHPFGVGSNLALQATVTDKGEPGSSDSIAMTLWRQHPRLLVELDGSDDGRDLLSGGNTAVD